MTTILDMLAHFLQLLAEACAPAITYALLKRVGLQQSSMAISIVQTAIMRAAGAALAHGVAVGDPLLASAEAKNTGLAKAIDYVQNNAGPQLAKLGISDASVAAKVSAQLALALHAPTVTATQDAVMSGMATIPLPPLKTGPVSSSTSAKV